MSVQVQKTLLSAGVSSFIGLQSYSEAQADSFFGRDEEISQLTRLIQSNTLTIVFGKSGTGKTSLLNAGVFPRLRRDYSLPFRIRLEFMEESPDLISQVKEVLKTEIDKYGFTVEHYPGPETLWEYFHREPLWSSVTPILVFDQFEEIFTLARKSTRFRNAELEIFWGELADLIENSIPETLKEKFLNDKESIGYSYKHQKVKILFSFREEFLPEFESITSRIPSIKYSRFRLLQMSGHQAYEVITKTWKNNIDPAEAKQIVGFFADEDDIDKGYEQLEIEPSLLSQVCSYIDRERILGGHDKISAAMLNKYPREIILRSIYNEVLVESNDAIKTIAGQAPGSLVNLVKEFVEDKLITDEGYRTRYTLTPQDEVIRPGIDVLTSKYYLRDDGKSVELTHDVLVPFIKSDRENMRKEIALALARKKAQRRSVLIIIVSLLAAALTWYLVTNKAFRDKEQAIAETEKLKDQITSDSTLLAGIADSIKNSRANLKALKKGRTGGSGEAGDSLQVDNEAADSILLGMQNRYAALQKHYDDLNFNKSRLDSIITRMNARMNDVAGKEAKTTTENSELRQYIVFIKKRYYDDSMRLVRNFDLLSRQFAEYKLRYPARVWPPAEGEMAMADTNNSLHLNLFYSTEKGAAVPGNLKIYLIPDSSYNRKIIKDAKVYEIYCEDLNLERAKGGKIASFSNKVYTFHDVPPGNYFVKICAYYGGYYSIKKKAKGIETSAKLDLSPPIR